MAILFKREGEKQSNTLPKYKRRTKKKNLDKTLVWFTEFRQRITLPTYIFQHIM